MPESDGIVLIVENEPLVREALEEILRASGLNTISAARGTEAIEAFAVHQDEIALVILDMRMPGMDGPAALKTLWEHNSDLKAIIASGYDEQEIRKGFNRDQTVSILKKPFDADTLLSMVYGKLAA